jgi:hypothetical protein
MSTRSSSAPNRFIDQPLKVPTLGGLAVFRSQTAQTFRGGETANTRLLRDSRPEAPAEPWIVRTNFAASQR